MPRTASTTPVPRSFAPAGCSPSVTVTAPWNVVSTLPLESIALTRTAGDGGWPGGGLPGGVNSSRAGGGSDAPPSWSSLLISQLTSQLRARMPAPRRGQGALRNKDDTEGTAGRLGQPRHARLEGVIHAGLVDAQVREGRDPVYEARVRGAAQLSVLGDATVGPDRDGHLACEAPDGAPGRVLGRNLDLERVRQRADRRRGLDSEGELRRRRGAGDAERRPRRVVRRHGYRAGVVAAHLTVARHAAQRGPAAAGGPAPGGGPGGAGHGGAPDAVPPHPVGSRG